ncbi:uncharacterized protein LOC113553979 isoform X1 [Rhopalosiphum maidis]|uniref:uncharacterized protein LOC113553979 isoform X1 n=1 Tax=Rhopalosiphum maidis TaxID=43146 RepID=UPI000EFDB515|nr:uncharacterized protein LOC113553979 isoform X1 [Rhopalosiphum maidis]
MTEDIIYHSTGSKCALSFCKNIFMETGGEGQLSFFSFPKNPVRCAIWVENYDSKYLPKVAVHNLSRRYKLCSLHFEDRMFDFQKKGLLSNAVPTLFKKKLPVIKPVTSKNINKIITVDDNKIPPAIPIDATPYCSKHDKIPVIKPVTSKNIYKIITVDDNKIPPAIPIDATPSCSKHNMYISQPLFDKPTRIGLNSVSLQTPASLSAGSPRKRKLRKKLSEEINLKKRLEKTVIELTKQLEETKTENNCLKLCEMYLPPTMYMLVKNYLINKYKSPNGQRYLKEITQFAYTIYHLGPKAYNFLQNHFNLPIYIL